MSPKLHGTYLSNPYFSQSRKLREVVAKRHRQLVTELEQEHRCLDFWSIRGTRGLWSWKCRSPLAPSLLAQACFSTCPPQHPYTSQLTLAPSSTQTPSLLQPCITLF